MTNPTDAVAEGRTLVEALIAQHERALATPDPLRNDWATDHSANIAALRAFLTHTAAQSRQLAEVREAVEKLPTTLTERRCMCADGTTFRNDFCVSKIDLTNALRALFPRSPETNDAGGRT